MIERRWDSLVDKQREDFPCFVYRRPKKKMDWWIYVDGDHRPFPISKKIVKGNFCSRSTTTGVYYYTQRRKRRYM